MGLSRKNIFMALFVLSLTSFSVMAMYGGKVVNEGRLVWVSHTEYWANGGELAQAIVRLTNYKGQPINANWCNATIYYPNKTVWKTNEPMAQSSVAGNWYYNFSLEGQPMGIYEEEVNCSYGAVPKYISTSESFHVNPALNLTYSLNQSLSAMNLTLEDLRVNVTAIKNDTTYIVNNMVTNDTFNDWKNNATTQMIDMQNNLTTEINTLCSDTYSNSSDLCQTLYSVYAFQQAQNVTFTNYFENITETTTNTWDYMTGTLYTKLNDTYNVVFDINQTVTDIKTNVTDIRQDQVDEVHINIIS